MRKSIVSILLASALVVGSAAAVSAAEDAYKVGVVKFLDHASLNQIEDNILAELDALSEEKGVTFDYEGNVYNGNADGATLQQIATQLVEDEVDVIVAIATPAAQVVQSALEDTKIPLIFSAVGDPVGAGLAVSMDEPGMNITGTSDALNTEAILNLMFALDPQLDYVGLLYSKSEDSSKQPIEDAKAFLEEQGIKYVEKTGTNNDEVSSAVDALIAEGVGAIFTPTDNTVMNAELAIFEKLEDAGIPHYTGADSFALNGAFLGFGINYADLGVATADMVAEVLVDGADPAATPVRTFDNGIATINTETAQALGIDLDAAREAFAPFCSAIEETTTAEEFE